MFESYAFSNLEFDSTHTIFGWPDALTFTEEPLLAHVDGKRFVIIPAEGMGEIDQELVEFEGAMEKSGEKLEQAVTKMIEMHREIAVLRAALAAARSKN